MKKTSSQKTTSKKEKAKTSTQKATLEKQLKDLIKDIDVEGLLFLIKQAHIILHNIQVDKINKEFRKIEQIERTTRQQKQSQKQKSSFNVDIEEGPNASHFVLILNGQRKMFSRAEMGKIVNICQVASNKSDGSERLFTWLKRNRTDVLLDLEIQSRGNPLLAALYQFLKKRYTGRH